MKDFGYKISLNSSNVKKFSLFFEKWRIKTLIKLSGTLYVLEFKKNNKSEG